MKKILALALVLVLALGMAVPTFAAKPKVTGIESLTSDTSHEDDIHPGTNVKIPFKLSEFSITDEAQNAIDTAKDSGKKSVVEKIVKTMEPRFRVRSGGQIFSDIYFDNFSGPKTEVNKNTILKAIIEATKGKINKDSKATDTQKSAAVAKVAKIAWANLGTVDLAAATAADLETWIKTAIVEVNFATAADIAAAATTAFKATVASEQATFGSDWTFDVVLETINPWASVNDVDYEVDVYFLIDGKRTDNEYIHTVTGNFSNTVTEVNKDTYDADSYEGQVIKATEYVPKIAIVGNYDYNVTATVKMAKDKKIYFYVTTENEVSDEGLLEKYPTIEVAFKVLQLGLNNYTGNFIKLGGVDATYYVYAKDAEGALKYLGRGGEMLPLSAKYYVSTKKLDIEEANIDEELPTETETVPNENLNPPTGI